jgi:hypothetical protein
VVWVIPVTETAQVEPESGRLSAHAVDAADVVVRGANEGEEALRGVLSQHAAPRQMGR